MRARRMGREEGERRRTVSGNSSVAACSRRLSSRSPKKTGSGFVRSSSDTLLGSIGSASKRRPGRVEVPGTGRASPTGGAVGVALAAAAAGFDDPPCCFSPAAAPPPGFSPHLFGSFITSFMRASLVRSSRLVASQRDTTERALSASRLASSSKSDSVTSSVDMA